MNHKIDVNSEDFKRVLRLKQLEDDFYELEKITDKWGFFRQIYMEMLPWIMERAAINVVNPINPYTIDWTRHFSPIELSAWYSIRGHYMALYPQFPVFNSFIDFANPYLRIGLELDGKDYHDPVKDKVRDTILFKHGWRIFRVKGKECFHEFKSIDIIQENHSSDGDDEEMNRQYENWMMNSCDGVVKALKIVYFSKNEDHFLYSLAHETLLNHRGCDFDLFEDGVMNG